VIKYISLSYCGSGHDFSILKEEFSPKKSWFKEFEVLLDLGFLGFESQYDCKNVSMPIKKKKNTKLTNEQKQENKKKSQQRVIVEHSIGGLKRFKILVDRLRIKRFDFYDEIVGVCAGLWNYKLRGITH
jgi:hypothetical protein